MPWLFRCGAAAVILLLPACMDKMPDDEALACSISSNWVRATSSFQPQGQKSRRLSPEDRRLASDSRVWRALALRQDVAALCGTPSHSFGNLKVSRDGNWALAEFSSEWSVEQCLARRQGEKWAERECDVIVHIEPVLPPPVGAGRNSASNRANRHSYVGLI